MARVWCAIDGAVREAAQLSAALQAVRALDEEKDAHDEEDAQSAETRATLRVQHWRTLVEAALAHALTCATLTALVHVTVHVHVAALSRALYAAQAPALKPLLATLSDETLQHRFLSGAFCLFHVSVLHSSLASYRRNSRLVTLQRPRD